MLACHRLLSAFTRASFLGVVVAQSMCVGRAAADDSSADKKLPPLIRTAQSGAWSDRATWEDGKLPRAGERVQICTQHKVVYDVKSDTVLRSIHVAGTLVFAPDATVRRDCQKMFTNEPRASPWFVEPEMLPPSVEPERAAADIDRAVLTTLFHIRSAVGLAIAMRPSKSKVTTPDGDAVRTLSRK